MLQVRIRDGFAEPVVLEPPGCTVGSGRVNDLVIESEQVAPFHADIQVAGHRVTITDTGTTSGTFVNGRRVITPASLKAGDTVTVGGVELLIETRFKAVKVVELTSTGLVETGSGGWSLLAESGPDAGERIPVTGRMRFGRSSACHISIFDPGLSREHAEFRLEKGELSVQDLGSANGTWVNSQRVAQTTLQDGDIIRFDRLIYRVIAPQ